MGAVLTPAVFAVSATSLYVGAVIGVLLFAVVDPAGVAWLRTLGAAVVLLVWRRPGRAVVDAVVLAQGPTALELLGITAAIGTVLVRESRTTPLS